MSGAITPFNICDTLRTRLQEINGKKEATQTEINAISDQLQKLFGKDIKHSRQTPAQLDIKIDELETKRTSSSLKLSEEKEILRQIAQIEKAKVVYESTSAHEKVIKDKKRQANELRTELSNYKAQVAELEAALSKVELADRLGCTANDLKPHKMNCPVDKLGQVIGKGGSNLKKLESKTGCLVDIDKVNNQIHLQGNETSIEKAIAEIENIILAVEIEMKLDKALFHFLFAKQLAEFHKLQKSHENVIFDLSKENLMLKIRGREHFVAVAKDDVMEIDVRMEILEIPAREAAVIVGKAGETINRLVADHDVGIQVENEKSSSDKGNKAKIIVSGQGNKVDTAMKEIKEILFKNEDVDISLLVTPMTRNRMLADSGTLVKKLQKDVNEACQPGNAFVRFEALSKEERDTNSILIVKIARMHMAKAELIVKERLELYDSSIFNLQIDIDLIPVIIGPKGATIKGLRKLGGAGSEIDLEKVSGELKVMADTEKGRNAMKAAIEKLVDENQILKVPMDRSLFADFFGQSGETVKSKIQDYGVFIKVDDSDTTALLLRGSIDKITEAAEDVRQFIASNQCIEFSCDSEDESFLNRRIKLLKKIGKDFNVRISMSKSSHGVIIKGKMEDNKCAEKELRKVLYGGDGYSVEKLVVPNSILGLIIGKGGKNIAKYESDFDTVMVNIYSMTRCLSIRGASENVDGCKKAILKDMVESKASESIQIDHEGYAKLTKPGILLNMVGNLPVTFTLVPNTLRLQGSHYDVQEVVTQVQDILTGVYKASITLLPENAKIVLNAIKTTVQIEEIRDTTGASILFDEADCGFVFEGKRPNVKRAKAMVLTFIESVVPTQFARVKFLKPLLKSMGSSKDVFSLSMSSECNITLERDVFAFVVQSPCNKKFQSGLSAIDESIKACLKLTSVIETESWIINHLLAKNVTEIDSININNECQITLSKIDLMISIIGQKEEDVSLAKTKIDILINQAKKENKFIDLPESSFNQFAGTSGRDMRSFASTYGVQMERVKKSKSRIVVKGSEASVSRASKAIDQWLSQWEKKNSGVSVSIEDSVIAHFEKQSSIVDDIQRKFGVKIDINRNNYTATVRGGKSDEQEKASFKLELAMSEVLTEQAKTMNNKENEVRRYPNESKVSCSLPEAAILSIMAEESEVDVPKPSTVVKTESVVSRKDLNNATGKLYNLLVSDDVAVSDVASDVQENSGVGMLFNLLVSGDDALSDVQEWDSSTVSSGIEEIESPETGISYYRSASGFHIRL